MKTLCTICAREGSRGVERKNLQIIAGRPLIMYSIEQARACPFVDKVVVSTDGQEIADVARLAGAEIPYLRPPELATDSVPKLGVIQHMVHFLLDQGEKYDIVIDLDPTSPLRSCADIETAYTCFLRSDATNLYSVCPARKNPYFNMVELDEEGRSRICKPLEREVASRQRAPQVYEMNASIYLFRSEYLLNPGAVLHSEKTIAYVMPIERSIDIDSPLDLKIVRLLLEGERK